MPEEPLKRETIKEESEGRKRQTGRIRSDYGTKQRRVEKRVLRLIRAALKTHCLLWMEREFAAKPFGRSGRKDRDFLRYVTLFPTPTAVRERELLELTDRKRLR